MPHLKAQTPERDVFLLSPSPSLSIGCKFDAFFYKPRRISSGPNDKVPQHQNALYSLRVTPKRQLSAQAIHHNAKAPAPVSLMAAEATTSCKYRAEWGTVGP